METNHEESNFADIITMLNAAITKYEDGLLALQGLPLIDESMQLDLNSAKELLFEGLKLLNIVYQYLKVPKIVEECVKVEIPGQIDHKLIINDTNSEMDNFKCDLCNKTFKIERFWLRHMLRVHGENIEKDEISYFDSKGIDSSQQ